MDFQSLQDEITPWVEEKLSSAEPIYYDAPKLVRDPVHGFIILSPLEVTILDSPILQRLHYIHQTGLAYLVYPGAQHTRFDHTIGVIACVEGIARAMATRLVGGPVDDRTIEELRLAALLHDVGHGPFSHLTESVVRQRFAKDFEQIRRQSFHGTIKYFRQAEPGEILSYAIVTSTPFRQFINSVHDFYAGRGKCSDWDIEDVAGLIIGRADDDAQFKADIINGPMDADKIDYLLRDCHFSGIKAEVDTQRICHTASILNKPGWRRYLVANAGALPHLEQILFAKMMLYTALYHHHKIRATGCMHTAIFELLHSLPEEESGLSSIADYVAPREFEFWNTCLSIPSTKPVAMDLLNRRLLKRALVVSPRTTTEATVFKITRLREEALKPGALRKLAGKIYGNLPARSKRGKHLLWIDVPTGPDIDEDAQHSFVDLGRSDPDTLAKVFPTDDWLKSYEANKLTIHVFYVDDREARQAAAFAARDVLKEEFEIELKDTAFTLAKLDPP